MIETTAILPESNTSGRSSLVASTVKLAEIVLKALLQFRNVLTPVGDLRNASEQTNRDNVADSANVFLGAVLYNSTVTKHRRKHAAQRSFVCSECATFLDLRKFLSSRLECARARLPSVALVFHRSSRLIHVRELD